MKTMQHTAELQYINPVYESLEGDDPIQQELADYPGVGPMVFREVELKEYQRIQSIKFKQYKVCDTKTKVCSVAGGIIVVGIIVAVCFMVTMWEDNQFFHHPPEEGDIPIIKDGNQVTLSFNFIPKSRYDIEKTTERLKTEFSAIINSSKEIHSNILDIAVTMNRTYSVVCIFTFNTSLHNVAYRVETAFYEHTKTGEDWNVIFLDFVIDRNSIKFTVSTVILPLVRFNSTYPTSVSTTTATTTATTATTTTGPLCIGLQFASCSNISKALLPNAFGHTSTDTIHNVLMSTLKPISVSQCHHEAAPLMCSLLLPPCEESNSLRPCDHYCTEVLRNCEPFSPQWLLDFDCSSLPSTDCYIPTVPSKASLFEVKLQDGSGSGNGRLMVRQNGSEWGRVCSQGWSEVDAKVLCQTLNQSYAYVLPSDGSHLVESTVPFVIKSVNCIGTESSFDQCHFIPLDGSTCSQDAAVTCLTDIDLIMDTTTESNGEQIQTTESDDFQVRLFGGPDETKGRVEVYYNGTWGTICRDMFDDNAATVVCNMLGMSDGKYELSRYGSGEGPIHFNNVFCNGTETSILDCFHAVPEAEQCTHIHDVSISCE